MSETRRGTGMALVGFASLAVSALVVRAAPSPRPGTPPPPPVRTASPHSAITSDGGVDAGPALNRCNQPSSAIDASDKLCEDEFTSVLARHDLCGGERSSSTFLIGTVPDPIESRVDQTFDSTVSAMMLAVETKAALSEFWLPWTEDREWLLRARMGTELDYLHQGDSISVRGRYSTCRSRWPGIVVFEKTWAGDAGPEASRVALLLVGELPTQGINRDALQRAIKTVQSQSLTVVGPQFSGAAYSLSTELHHVMLDGGVSRIKVITGGATSPLNQALLQGADAGPDAGLQFQSTVIPDDVSETTFYRYLVNSGLSESSDDCVMKNVALLSESDTVYGGAGAHAADAGLHGGNCLRPRYEIKFPLHVADVRSAWQREGHSAEKGNVLKLPPAAVSVDLRERKAEAKDNLPSFSEVTAAYDERSLAAALSILRENDVNVVGILASDSRDKLFLAEEVRRAAPDTQLFTFESDMLLTHPDYSDVMRGALVVTTYPLVTANQFWASRTPLQRTQPRLQFGMNSAEGFFNATLLALGQKDLLYEYAWPLVPGLSPDLLARGTPPLWISVIGAQGYWPIAALRYDDAHHYVFETPAVSLKGLQLPMLEMSRVDTAAFLVACVAILVLCLALVRLMREKQDLHPLPSLLRPLALLNRELFTTLTAGRQHAVAAFALAGMGLLIPMLVWIASIGSAAVVFRAMLLGTVGTDHFLNDWRHNVDYRELLRMLVASITLCAAVRAFVDLLGNLAPAPWGGVRTMRRVAWAFAGFALALVFLLFDFDTVFIGRPGPALAMLLVGAALGIPSTVILVSSGAERARLFSKLTQAAPAAQVTPAAQAARAAQATPTALDTRPTLLGWLPSWMAGTIGAAIYICNFARAAFASTGDGSGVFRYWRATHLASFLSPVLPTLSLAMIIFILGFNVLRLVAIDELHRSLRGKLQLDATGLDSAALESGLADATKLFAEVHGWIKQRLDAAVALSPQDARFGSRQLVRVYQWMSARLSHRLGPAASSQRNDVSFWLRWFVQLLVIVVPGLWTFLHVTARLDGFWGAWVIRVLATIAVMFCLGGVFHLWALWSRLEEFLDQCARSDLRLAFKRIRLHAAAAVGIGTRMRIGRPSSFEDLQRTVKRGAERNASLKIRHNADALKCVHLIAFAMARVRGIWVCISAASILFVLSITTYPVQPHRGLLLLSWFIVGMVTISTVAILVQMSRNEVLSHLSNTSPHKLSWNAEFVEKLVIFAGLPVLGIVSAQFPEVGRAIIGLFEPIFRGAH